MFSPRHVALGVLAFWVPAFVSAQTQSPTTAKGAELVQQVAPSLALVLVEEAGSSRGEAVGLIVDSDGILLTTYRAVKDARTVQVQLKNGEIFDRVQLIASDERRDVAALRISGTGLRPVPNAGLSDIRAGQEVYAISHTAGPSWTASGGVITSIKLADEIPGAGQGYRLVEFTAPISTEASGGVLVDAHGRVLGIAVGTIPGERTLNYAVPLESVLGLAQMAGESTLASSAAARQSKQEATLPVAAPAPAPSRGVEAFPVGESEPPVQPINPGGPELSQAIASQDPVGILRGFRTMVIISRTVWLKVDLMQEAMQKEPAMAAWGLAIVADPRIADVRLTVNRVLFTWTWTYELVHQNSGIILATGKMNAVAGGAATSKIADAVVLQISKARGMPPGVAPPKTK